MSGWPDPGRLWRGFWRIGERRLLGLILGGLMGLQGFGRLVSKSFWMQTELRSWMGCGRW